MPLLFRQQRAAQQGLRHELKYMIAVRDAVLLQHRLALAMDTDSHADAEGRYFIRSLYFDDFDFAAYRDKLNGVENRAKYRLRYYNFDDSFISFEKKEKIRDMTKKTAVRVSREQAEAMMERGDVGDTDNSLLQEFRSLWNAGLRPRVLVDYDRYVFAHPVGNTRITLDMAVRTSPCKTELFDTQLAMLPVLPPAHAVLEVKYNDAFPRHVGLLLEGVAKDRMAVSKYCRCLSILE